MNDFICGLMSGSCVALVCFFWTFLGSGMLKIDFVGELNDKMKGFYRSKYTAPSGEIRYAAVTQFEVTRHLSFPSFMRCISSGFLPARISGACFSDLQLGAFCSTHDLSDVDIIGLFYR